MSDATQSDITINSGFGTKGYRSYVLGALLLVYVFNFIDRTIINILTEPLRLAPVNMSLTIPTNCGPTPLPMIETIINKIVDCCRP